MKSINLNIFQSIMINGIAITIQILLLHDTNGNEKIIFQPQSRSEIILSLLPSINIIKNKINSKYFTQKQNDNKINIFLSLFTDIINKNNFYIFKS